MKILERYVEIISLREKGLSLHKIGRKHNVSGERIRQIIKDGSPFEKAKIVRPYNIKNEVKCFFCKTLYQSTRPNGRFCNKCRKTYQVEGRELTRMLVRIRDNFTCQDCGEIRTPKEAKRFNVRLFDIHHLNGMCGKNSRGYDRVKDMDGLITLCHRCHFNRPEHAQRLLKKYKGYKVDKTSK
jgi:hypothetical protein